MSDSVSEERTGDLWLVGNAHFTYGCNFVWGYQQIPITHDVYCLGWLYILYRNGNTGDIYKNLSLLHVSLKYTY